MSDEIKWPERMVNMPCPDGSGDRILGFRVPEGDPIMGDYGLSEPLEWLRSVTTERAAPTPPAEAHAGSVTDEYVLAVAEKLQELHWEIDPDGDETGIKDLRTALIYAQPPAEAQGVGGIDQRARELLAEQYQSSQGARQILSGPWTLEQDRAIRAIAAALSAQPRPYIDMHYGGPIPAPTDKPASAPVGEEGLPPDVQEMIREDKAGWALAKLAESHGAVREEDDNDLWWTLRIEQFKALAQQPAAVDEAHITTLRRMRNDAAGLAKDYPEPCASRDDELAIVAALDAVLYALSQPQGEG